jgi:hypothetical protein
MNFPGTEIKLHILKGGYPGKALVYMFRLYQFNSHILVLGYKLVMKPVS